MPVDLSTLEGRFWHDLDEVKSDAEAALHTKIVDAVVGVAKEILPLVPDGGAVEGILGKLDELAAEAHRAVSAMSADAPQSADSGAPEAATVVEAPTTTDPAPDAPAAAERTNEAGTVLPPQ